MEWGFGMVWDSELAWGSLFLMLCEDKNYWMRMVCVFEWWWLRKLLKESAFLKIALSQIDSSKTSTSQLLCESFNFKCILFRHFIKSLFLIHFPGLRPTYCAKWWFGSLTSNPPSLHLKERGWKPAFPLLC